MMYLVTPVLVEFEKDSQGNNQMTIWASTPLTQFLAKVNDCNHVFLSTGLERYVGGKWIRGFKAYPAGTERFRQADLSLCQVACLGGSLHLPPEENESSRSRTISPLLGGQQYGFVPRPGI